MGWSVAMPAYQHLLLVSLTKTVAAADAVRAPPALFAHADVALVLVKAFVVEVLLALGAVEELDSLQVGLVFANLARLCLALLADEELSFMCQAIFVEHWLKLSHVLPQMDSSLQD